jgi:hypothetical protein
MTLEFTLADAFNSLLGLSALALSVVTMLQDRPKVIIRTETQFRKRAEFETLIDVLILTNVGRHPITIDAWGFIVPSEDGKRVLFGLSLKEAPGLQVVKLPVLLEPGHQVSFAVELDLPLRDVGLSSAHSIRGIMEAEGVDFEIRSAGKRVARKRMKSWGRPADEHVIATARSMNYQ